jgi:N-acetylmuramoyl-L-alanine amidase
MLHSIRRAAILVACLAASSVAFAESAGNPASPEPLIIAGSNAFPNVVMAQPISAEVPVMPAVLNTSPPAPVLPGSSSSSAKLADLVARMRSSTVSDRQLECLAGAIYFESKSEPLAGQLAVGQVIANRAKSGRFPASYCGVVFQRGQFSFVRGNALPAIPRKSAQWRTAVAIANIVDQALHVSQVSKALFFHARRVSPRWRLTRIATVGNHVFYR